MSIVVFNSQVPIGTGQGVYMSGVAEQLGGAELDHAMDVYSPRVKAHGGRVITVEDVKPAAVYRLYRASVADHWMLDPGASPDQRTPVRI